MGRRRHRLSDRGDDGGGGGQRELPPLAGALGTERGRRRKKERRIDDPSADSRRKAKTAEEPVQNAPAAKNVLPTFLDAPKEPGDNLAGVPYAEKLSELGVKKISVKHVGPWIQTNLNNEAFIHFVVHSRTDEWIRFRKNSVSLVIFTEQQHAPTADAVAGTENAAEWRAARSTRGLPGMMMDPDIAGTGFFQRAEVIINNVVVPTSHTIGPLFVHYPRYMKIHAHEDEDNKRPHFTNQDQISTNAGLIDSPIMKKALEPFDHIAWNSRHGRRVEVHLDALFPFAMKSPIHEALENRKEPELYFGPDTTLELKLYFHRTRMECIWMIGANANSYWNNEVVAAPGYGLRTTIQDAVLEYECVELHPARHMALMERFRGGKEYAYYDYDINRGQNSAIIPNVSFTENNIQIWPYCRTLIIGFQPEHGLFPMTNNKPMTGFTTFPEGLTRMQIEFANTIHLISSSYENFGVRGEQNQLSKKQLYEYMKGKRLANYTFDDLWPPAGKGRSLVQDFAIDVRHLMSDKMQTLKISMEFGGEAVSPANLQIAVISIHPNGRATCKNLSDDRCNWEWEFSQVN